MEGKEIICRCEEVSKEEIIKSIQLGDITLEAVKKRTRAGMGYCQGKSCKRLIARLLSIYTAMDVNEFLPGSIRLPVGPIPLHKIAELSEEG